MNPAQKRILFLTISGIKGASSRYRVYQALPFFEKAGYATRVMPPAERKGRGIARLFKGVLEESACIRAAGEHDIIFIQKRLFSRVFLDRLRRLGKKVAFDFDDSIFTSPGGDWSAATRRKVAARLSKTFEVSDLVVAGNEFLKGRAAGMGAMRVEVLPTAIDVGRYKSKGRNQSSGPAVLGWIGSSVNHPYLDMLSGVLKRLAEEFSGIKLLVVSDRDYRMEGIEVENRRWAEETEADDLLDMDIGLMPLPDDDWTRGKCALKALQYMASGVPAVCSAVGANKEAIEHGVDGLLCAGDDEWLYALRALVASPDKRAAIGATGRRKVEQKYSLINVAGSLVGFVKDIP